MTSNQRAVLRLAVYVLICVVVAGSTFSIGYAAHATQSPLAQDSAAFSVFWEAWGLINQYFYGEKPDEAIRARGAIKGSLATLSDPYTMLVEPQQRDREQEELRGSFGGIGVLVSRTADGRIIMSPMEGKSAAREGILEGDELIAVDDLAITPQVPFDDVLAAVRGPVGQTVRLTIRREGVDQPLVFEVKREEIVTPSVTWALEEPGIGYIKLAIFSERTNSEMEEAIRDLQNQGANSFIIDLRDNGGGLLGAAIDVASQFLQDGVVMYERTSNGEEKPYPVKGDGLLLDAPVVFLVNGGTASASEIVAGAIQDYGRAKLIGTKTFGKASVQLLFDLEDGSSLHITNAHWLTPSRNEINGVGLIPDIEVTISDQDRENGVDPQRERAGEYLREISQAGLAVSSEERTP
jgi:carboxyl-terminal processing protease